MPAPDRGTDRQRPGDVRGFPSSARSRRRRFIASNDPRYRMPKSQAPCLHGESGSSQLVGAMTIGEISNRCIGIVVGAVVPGVGARTSLPGAGGRKTSDADSRPGVVTEQSRGLSAVPPKQAMHQRVPSALVAQQIAGTWFVKGGRVPPSNKHEAMISENCPSEIGVRMTSARTAELNTRISNVTASKATLENLLKSYISRFPFDINGGHDCPPSDQTGGIETPGARSVDRALRDDLGDCYFFIFRWLEPLEHSEPEVQVQNIVVSDLFRIA